MLALFKCCDNPFFGAAKHTNGISRGPGFWQNMPIVLRVRCPRCSQLSEARLDSPCIIAHILPSTREGLLSLREPHGATLEPVQVTPGRRTEIPVEDEQTLCRAWHIISAISTASSAGLPPRPGDLSPELSALIIGHYQPDIYPRALAASRHCALANSSLESPPCNWEIVRMAWKLAPAPTENAPSFPWHGLSNQG
jgi:hypothetical protein